MNRDDYNYRDCILNTKYCLDKLDQAKIEVGYFYPLQVKSMLESGKWTINTNTILRENQVVATNKLLGNLISKGSVCDKLEVSYIKNEDDGSYMIIDIYNNHIISEEDIDFIFTYELFNKQVDKLNKKNWPCFIFVDYDYVKKILKHCHDNNLKNYCDLISDEAKLKMDKNKGSIFFCPIWDSTNRFYVILFIRNQVTKCI